MDTSQLNLSLSQNAFTQGNAATSPKSSQISSHEKRSIENPTSPTSKHVKDVYTPSKSHISSEVMTVWLHAPITGNIKDVPGIGDANANHLLQCSESVSTTFELIGKFMSFKKAGVTPVEHCDKFYAWLKDEGGVHMNRHDIVQAVAMKCNIMFPGIYDEDAYK